VSGAVFPWRSANRFELLIDGKSNSLKPVSGSAFVELTISPATKSASIT